MGHRDGRSIDYQLGHFDSGNDQFYTTTVIMIVAHYFPAVVFGKNTIDSLLCAIVIIVTPSFISPATVIYMRFRNVVVVFVTTVPPLLAERQIIRLLLFLVTLFKKVFHLCHRHHKGETVRSRESPASVTWLAIF